MANIRAPNDCMLRQMVRQIKVRNGDGVCGYRNIDTYGLCERDRMVMRGWQRGGQMDLTVCVPTEVMVVCYIDIPHSSFLFSLLLLVLNNGCELRCGD